MSNPFARFYNTEAVIVEKGDYDDYENTYTLTEKGRVNGDLQPYSGGLLEKEYGLNIECQKRFFCEHNENITEGAYLKIGTRFFEVVYIVDWEMGLTVMLKEVTLNA